MDSARFLGHERRLRRRDRYLLSQKRAIDQMKLPHNATENR